MWLFLNEFSEVFLMKSIRPNFGLTFRNRLINLKNYFLAIYPQNIL